MGSKDVIDLCKNVGQGAEVFVVRGPVGNSVQTSTVAVASNAPDSATFYGNN